MMLQTAFINKTVLVTGHTGFKGSWLIAWLRQLGANVVGVALDPPTEPSHFAQAQLSNQISDLRIDVRDRVSLERAIISAEPDFIFHLAAQSLVKRSYDDPVETWQINVLGTVHLLESLRKLDKPCAAVVVTSDKCYDNVEWVWGYRETDAMGGPDPYSGSKGAAELAIRSYIKSFFPEKNSKVRIASARAGNVIGGGDWAADRIVPDCVKAWSIGESVELRNPKSTRPWQHVLEPLSGYLTLAIELSKRPELHGESFNFGPQAEQNRSVLELVQEMSLHWPSVRWGDLSTRETLHHESNLLKLNCDKALHCLGWNAAMGFEDTVRMTAIWYALHHQQKKSMEKVTNQQISEYIGIARGKGVLWAQ
jgi:CDP-glucose 4,6-dehydratase